MIFNSDAPPIRASRLTARPAFEIAGLVLHAIADGIEQGRETPGGLDVVTRLDYVHEGSRVDITITVGNGGTLVNVRYLSTALDAVIGLVALRLRRWLGIDVTVGDYVVSCIVPLNYRVARFTLGRRPKPDEPEDDLDIIAERHFEAIVGTMITDFRTQSNPVGFGRQSDPSWKDPAYGVVGINAHASHTYERLPGEDRDSPRTNHVGVLTVRIFAAGRDLLPHMVDIAAFARRHGLTFVRGANESGFWKFLFVHSVPTA